MVKIFDPRELTKLYKPNTASNNEDNGQITIIGGSDLFHGAPILALKAASRIVDMVFFASPEPTMRDVATQVKSQISSFIWVPWDQVESYIAKSDAVLIGSGMKRWHKEEEGHKYKGKVDIFDEAGTNTKFITEKLLRAFPNKKWVIDAGSLQVIDPKVIPQGAILTPNKKEFRILFQDMPIEKAAKKYNCIIVLKGETTIVCSPTQCIAVKGGNAGLTKGGTGDIEAGLTVGWLAKNDAVLASSAASWIVKKTADVLLKEVGFMYSADDVVNNLPRVMNNFLKRN